MKNHKLKFIDDIGRVVSYKDGLMELLKQGKSINGLLSEDCDDTRKYNQYSNNKLVVYTKEMASQTKEEYDSAATEQWLTPDEYLNIDIVQLVTDKCHTDEELTRVLEELNMYEERNLFPILRHLIFLIDHFRKNNIIWGVGRGSSVSSYVLYLMGVHRVNSIKYELDINEFLR